MAGALIKIIRQKTMEAPAGLASNKSVEDLKKDMQEREDKKAQFLSDMSQIESSGGLNTAHKMIQSGIHAGEKAVGQYGLMPNTINEMVNRMKSEGNEPYEIHVMKLAGKPDDQEMANEVATNPELERSIAERLYNHVNDKYMGDQDKMNYAWQMGHNTPSEQITVEKLEDNPRTEKFKKLHQVLAVKK